MRQTKKPNFEEPAYSRRRLLRIDEMRAMYKMAPATDEFILHNYTYRTLDGEIYIAEDYIQSQCGHLIAPILIEGTPGDLRCLT